MYMTRTLLVLLLASTSLAKDKPAKAPSVPAGSGTGSNPSTKSEGTAGHHGPYEAVGDMLKYEKKKTDFFEPNLLSASVYPRFTLI